MTAFPHKTFVGSADRFFSLTTGTLNLVTSAASGPLPFSMLPNPPEQIAALLARPVAVLGAGAGVSGQGVLALLGALGAKGVITYWNDSKATNFHAVEVALAGFATPVLWIGGGKAKGGDLAAFVRRIARRVKHAFLIGETQPTLTTYCRELQVPATLCVTLAEAVRGARALAVPGDHVLRSPGFASFDMFRGYDDRGRQFQQLVENL